MRLERVELRVRGREAALELERVARLAQAEALQRQRLGGGPDDDLEVAAGGEPQGVEAALCAVGAEAVAHPQEVPALDGVAVALREVPLLRRLPQRLGELQAHEAPCPARRDELRVGAHVVLEVDDHAAQRVRRHDQRRTAEDELLPRRRLVLQVVDRAHGDGQRVDGRCGRDVAHAPARPRTVDHGRERAGLQVTQRCDAVLDERARGPLVGDDGTPAVTLAALEAPREGGGVHRHRRREPPDVDRRLEGVARQEPALPGGRARVEALRVVLSLRREQERRPDVELGERRERAEREDARDEHVAARGQGDVAGLVEPVLGVPALAAAADAPAVEEQLVALVGADAQAHGLRRRPVEAQAIRRDERRLLRVGAAHPGGGPLPAAIPLCLLEQRRERCARTRPWQCGRGPGPSVERPFGARPADARGNHRRPEGGSRRLQDLASTHTTAPRRPALSLLHGVAILRGSSRQRGRMEAAPQRSPRTSYSSDSVRR